MAVYVDTEYGGVTRIRLIGWVVYEEEESLYTVGMLPPDEDGYMIMATPPPEEHLFIDYASADEWEQEQHHYNQEASRMLAEHEGVLGEEDEDGGE
jgi:hypothetical protein